jgi:acyl-CoA reductase-like NAD-dependent aldehyde dehydrogenase
VPPALAEQWIPSNVQREIEGLSMKKILGAACGLIVFAGVSGCDSNGDKLAKDQIKLTNEIAEAIEKGVDSAKLEEIRRRATENSKKIEALPADERKELEEKYKDELQKANARLLAAMTKNVGKGIPDVKPTDVSRVRAERRRK